MAGLSARPMCDRVACAACVQRVSALRLQHGAGQNHGDKDRRVNGTEAQQLPHRETPDTRATTSSA
eukprot:6202500-Pleurochrysis_carterae.AAC.1